MRTDWLVALGCALWRATPWLKDGLCMHAVHRVPGPYAKEDLLYPIDFSDEWLTLCAPLITTCGVVVSAALWTSTGTAWALGWTTSLQCVGHFPIASFLLFPIATPMG
jgi:hypothetical protein